MIKCRTASLALLISSLGAGCGPGEEETQDVDPLNICPDCDRPDPPEPPEPQVPWTYFAAEGPVSLPFGLEPEQSWRASQYIGTGFVGLGASPGYFVLDNLENSQPISWYGTTYWSCTNPDQFITLTMGSETHPLRLGAWDFRWLSQGCFYGAYVWAEMHFR
jgi:hypothetical protein